MFVLLHINTINADLSDFSSFITYKKEINWTIILT